RARNCRSSSESQRIRINPSTIRFRKTRECTESSCRSCFGNRSQRPPPPSRRQKIMNDQYTELYSSYQWFVPSQFNIAQACAHRWAESPVEGRRIAIFHENDWGRREVWTYTRLSETSNQLANGLVKMGVRPGDRVALVMGQRPE